MNDNGTSHEKTYRIKVERITGPDTAEAVCEGDVHVPDWEDIIALDDLLEAVKVHDLWEDGEDPSGELGIENSH